jgi:hypothetical protein
MVFFSEKENSEISKDLFICHCHRDKSFARRLAQDLSALSVPVWFDEWELAIGDSLHECIGVAIEKAAYVGILLSPDSINSQWCRSELDQALTREKRTGRNILLPLLYRRVTPPPFLEGRIYLNFTRSYFGSLAALAGQLHGIKQSRLMQLLYVKKPKSLEDVKVILTSESLNPINVINLPEDKYRIIRKELESVGVNIRRDMFQIGGMNLLHPDGDTMSNALLIDSAIKEKTSPNANDIVDFLKTDKATAIILDLHLDNDEVNNKKTICKSHKDID